MSKKRMALVIAMAALLALAGWCLPSKASAQSPNQLGSTLCGATPDAAATAWLTMFPTASDPSECFGLCRFWLRTCFTIVGLTNTCYLKEYLQESILRQGECDGDLVCIANETAALKVDRDAELALFEQGKATCLSNAAACLTSCQGT